MRLSLPDYLALHAVSGGLISTMVTECPYKAWFESWLNPNPPPPDDTAETDAGSIAHEILLEDSEDRVAVIDPADYPAKTTGAIPTGWTNNNIRDARDQARASGKIPILLPAMTEIRAMVDSTRKFVMETTERAVFEAFQARGGESEVTVLWDDDGVPCRIRPDRIANNKLLIVDAKFTGASAQPDSWGRTQMVRMNYYIGAAFYRRGIQRVYGVEPDYVYLVTETSPPYLTSLVGVDPHAFELGAAKVEYGLQLWKKCLSSGVFPKYPRQVVYPEIPAWADAEWNEREATNWALGAQG